jgi:peptidoglycan/LPS O-acetylase OafA/YrhL
MFAVGRRLTVDYMGDALFEPWTLVGKASVDLFFVISDFIMALARIFHQRQVGGLVPKRVFIGS